MRVIHRWWVDSPGRGPIMRKEFSCHDVSTYYEPYTWAAEKRQNSQIPQFTSPMSHKASFETKICTFLFWMVHCKYDQVHCGICETRLLMKLELTESIQACTKISDLVSWRGTLNEHQLRYALSMLYIYIYMKNNVLMDAPFSFK